jgi:GDP/UDP-N,N'-diacetylbacillosamine 2-epimerase (hydrolysing)
MQYASLIVGNSSSGIIEAASFGKYVINIGDRQKGRLASDNVINCKIESQVIFENVQTYFDRKFIGANIFKVGKAAELISGLLKNSIN